MFDFLTFYFSYVSLFCFLMYAYKGSRTCIQSNRWKMLSSVRVLMVMDVMRMDLSVFANGGNGFECFCKCNIFLFSGLE